MRCQLLLLLSLVACSPAWAKNVDLDYHVRFLPDEDQAEGQVSADATSPEALAEEDGVGAIIVTANRREERLH